MAHTHRRLWTALPALVLLGAALHPGPAAALEDPCKVDADRFCSSRSAIDLLGCLQSHRADLTPECREHLEWALVRIQSMIQACEPDAFQYCKNVGRGEPTATCLSASQGRLTRRCQDVFDAFARKEAAAASDCSFDASRSCPGVKLGKGDVFLCLLFHGKDLSPACRKAMVR